MTVDELAASGSRDKRLNMRRSEEASTTIREAAELQQQDLTSFVLGAALDRARSILGEGRILRLTPQEVEQLEHPSTANPRSFLSCRKPSGLCARSASNSCAD